MFPPPPLLPRSVGLRGALLALLVIGCVTSAPARNVLILFADDFGAMDFGAANPDTFYETPNLDRLARSGVRFTSGYSSSPVCSPARYSLFTGRYPTRAGLTNFLVGKRVERFEPAPLTEQLAHEETTLAEILRPAGHRTAFVGKWHLGPDESTWPEAHGFEVNIGGFRAGTPPSWFSPYRNPRLSDGPKGEFLTARLAEESGRLLEQFAREAKPFLLVHCFHQVHTPLQAPEELVAKYRAKAERLGLRDAFAEETQYHVTAKGPRQVRTVQSHATYAAMVESMDRAVGYILGRLEQLGLADSTLVFFVSDNGGLSTSEGLPTSNLPLRGGKGWVYEGGVRVPFLARIPGGRSGQTDDTPVITPDVFATALEFAGAKSPADRPIDGVSLLPLLRGQPAPRREALYWHYPHYSNQGGFPGGAIRAGDWKLVENYENGAVSLYRLSSDIGEREDLAAAEPRRVADLRARLHAWYRETGAQFLRAKDGGPAPWRPGTE